MKDGDGVATSVRPPWQLAETPVPWSAFQFLGDALEILIVKSQIRLD